MILYVDMEIAFYKIQYLFLIKSLQKPWTDGNFLNLITNVYKTL